MSILQKLGSGLSTKENIESSSMGGDKAGTVHSIQLLRFVAAAMVVIYHSYVSFIPSSLLEHSSGTSYWVGFGKVGVHIFFVISGYIMYVTCFYRKRIISSYDFILRRILRLYPVYWIFVVLYIIYDQLSGIMPSLSALQFIELLLLVPPSSSLIIGPAWTLSFEMYFYLIFGAAIVLGARRGAIAVSVFLFVSAGIGAIFRPDSAVAALVTNSLLIEFAMGVWVARLTTIVVIHRRMGWLAIAGAVAGFAGGLAWGYDLIPSALVWGIPSTFLIAGVVVLEQRKNSGHFSFFRRLSWLGNSSYSLYLLHLLIIETLMRLYVTTKYDVKVVTFVILSTVLAIILSVIFHNIIERPLIKFLHNGFLSVR